MDSRHPTKFQAREHLYNLLDDSLNSEVTEGIKAYVAYIEQQISECERASKDTLKAVFGADADFKVQLLDLIARVFEALQHLDMETSLSTLAIQLLSSQQTPSPPDDLDDEDNVVRGEHHVVFACIGWLTMNFVPSTQLTGPELRLPNLSATDSRPPAARSGLIHRPLGGMFRQMGLLALPCPVLQTPQLNSEYPDGPLHERTLNVAVICYASLRTIAGVRIVWTESLLEHCRFDSTTLELKIFRFPSYCIAIYKSDLNRNIHFR